MECYGFFTVLKNLCLINFWRHHVSTIFWKTKMSYLFRLCTWISRHRLSVIGSLWFFYACKNSEVTASVVNFCSDSFHGDMLWIYPCLIFTLTGRILLTLRTLKYFTFFSTSPFSPKFYSTVIILFYNNLMLFD